MEEKEKNDDIIEAEISSSNDKRNHLMEIILIIIIGLLLGVMLKTEALKRFSIGFNDYKVITGEQGYDINDIEKKLLEEKNKEAEKAQAVVENAKNQKGAVDSAENKDTKNE